MQRLSFPLLFLFFLLLQGFGCRNRVSEKPTSTHLGSFSFDVPAAWNISRSGDTLFLDSENVRMSVFVGLRLNLTLLNPSCSDKKYDFLDVDDKRDLFESDMQRFPSAYYPDSIPSLKLGIYFSVSIDSVLWKCVCYPDTGNYFPSEFLAVHNINQSGILFQLIKGEKSRDGKSVFALANQSIKFNSDSKLPQLVAFSGHDTAFHNHKDSAGDTMPEILIHENIVEVHGCVVQPGTQFNEMYGLVSVSHDSLFLKTQGSDWTIVFSKKAKIFMHAPVCKRLQCGPCGAVQYIYFKIELPENSPQYKIIFDKNADWETENIKD